MYHANNPNAVIIINSREAQEMKADLEVVMECVQAELDENIPPSRAIKLIAGRAHLQSILNAIKD